MKTVNGNLSKKIWKATSGFFFKVEMIRVDKDTGLLKKPFGFILCPKPIRDKNTGKTSNPICSIKAYEVHDGEVVLDMFIGGKRVGLVYIPGVTGAPAYITDKFFKVR